MSEGQQPLHQVRAKSYPNAFLFGFIGGNVLQLITRNGTVEPLCARPFSYLRTGLVLGFAVSYWDYWRRTALEEVLYAEEKTFYHMQVKAINSSVRFGEEDDI